MKLGSQRYPLKSKRKNTFVSLVQTNEQKKKSKKSVNKREVGDIEIENENKRSLRNYSAKKEKLELTKIKLEKENSKKSVKKEEKQISKK